MSELSNYTTIVQFIITGHQNNLSNPSLYLTTKRNSPHR